MSATDRPPPPRIALSVEEACQSLGVSWQTWNDHIAQDIRLIRVGSRKLIPVDALRRWCEQHAEMVL